MRLALAALLFSVVPAVAHADAIVPYDGRCPPGLVIGISGHAEACIPRACERDAQCGGGAACRPVHECWAEREVSRQRLAGTERRRVVVGACDAERHCADADATCETRRQCEPTAPTPAWDRTNRRWTRVSHPGVALAHCGVGHGGSAAPLLALALAALALGSRRARP